ncbi:response regulator [Rhodospirillum centenum]|uniref:Response regulator receiver domain protein n=1 Tax=Rhodospirillum centenum (strain ATCC 51521 / SW) TaxID=414684 RepID=B6IPF4_RHOCS|nr:response regulator [Rhodospirillum centenum]ACI99656.1 response regulator receiver domain protein [Rhodospirillum centenum SW]
MAEIDLHPVNCFLVDREMNTRRILRSILARAGIDKIQEFSTVAELVAAMASTTPDLIFIEADHPEGETLRFVSHLRHGQFATNPFVCVVATTWQATQQVLLRFTASGADDLMVKPFSTKQVLDRVYGLVHARKSFVVTSDYIGPDRRKTPRDGPANPLIEVPNTLRLKALAGHERTDLAAQMATALEAIDAQKVLRHGFHIAFLVDFALPGLAQEPPDRMAVEHLARVGPVADDLLRRVHDPDMRPHVETFVRALHAHLDRLKANPGRAYDNPTALRRAAMGVAALTARRSDMAALEQEVQAAVTGYRSRLEQMAQAKAESQGPPPGDPAAS